MYKRVPVFFTVVTICAVVAFLKVRDGIGEGSAGGNRKLQDELIGFWTLSPMPSSGDHGQCYLKWVDIRTNGLIVWRYEAGGEHKKRVYTSTNRFALVDEKHRGVSLYYGPKGGQIKAASCPVLLDSIKITTQKVDRSNQSIRVMTAREGASYRPVRYILGENGGHPLEATSRDKKLLPFP